MKKLFCIPQINNLNEWYSISQKYNVGFEYNDFFYPENVDDKEKYNDLIKKYQMNQPEINTLHGAFFDVIINSYDAKIASIGKERIIESIETAIKLNCKKVVFHTNLDPNLKQKYYLDRWLTEQANFYKDLAIKYPNIEIVLENMFDEAPYMLKKLVETINMPNVKICLDIAHAYISKAPVSTWINELKPYISHIHVNDNDGVVDSHLAIGEGKIPYEEFISFINENDVTVLIEVKGIEDFVKSYNNLISRGLIYGK